MKKSFNEGEEHFIWAFNHSTNQENLQIATLHACEKCGKPATVNSVWILQGYPMNAETAKAQATALKAEFGLLTELSATEDGDSFCETCYHLKEAI